MTSTSSTSGPCDVRGGGRCGRGSGRCARSCRGCPAGRPGGHRGRCGHAGCGGSGGFRRRVIGRVVAGVLAAAGGRRGRHGCGCHGAGRLRCPARAVRRCSGAVRAALFGALFTLFGALLGGGLFGLGLDGVLGRRSSVAWAAASPRRRLRVRGCRVRSPDSASRQAHAVRIRRAPRWKPRGLQPGRGGCLSGGRRDDAVAACTAAAATAGAGAFLGRGLVAAAAVRAQLPGPLRGKQCRCRSPFRQRGPEPCLPGCLRGGRKWP